MIDNPKAGRQRQLEQQRAQRAWESVSSVRNQGFHEDYYQLAKGAAADVQASGLGQTLAFWQAKHKGHHKQLFKDVSEWVLGQLHVQDAEGLLHWIMTTASTEDYRRATAEAMAFLVWLKRFSEAEIKD